MTGWSLCFIYFLRVVSDEHPRVSSCGFSGGSDLGQGQGHRGQRWDEVQHYRWRWEGHVWHQHRPHKPFWHHHSEKGTLQYLNLFLSMLKITGNIIEIVLTLFHQRLLQILYYLFMHLCHFEAVKMHEYVCKTIIMIYFMKDGETAWVFKAERLPERK